jgi:glycosyltransferase involved in cell wall biosynthesis
MQLHRRALRHLVEAMYRMALSGAHKVFFQNPDDEALFRTRGILPAFVPSRVVHGSPVCRLTSSRNARPETPSFLMIARLLGDKGVREYAAAARMVRGRFPDAHFFLAGWIDSNPTPFPRRNWKNGSGRECFGIWADWKMSALLSPGVPCMFLPSYREGTPRTILEAMSMGRAIITTDAPAAAKP